MSPGPRVTTPYGPGTVVKREGDVGILATRFCVHLDTFDSVPAHLDFTDMQERQGGLYFFDTELKTTSEKEGETP